MESRGAADRRGSCQRPASGQEFRHPEMHGKRAMPWMGPRQPKRGPQRGGAESSRPFGDSSGDWSSLGNPLFRRSGRICKHRVEAEDNRPRACPKHGTDHIHVAAEVRQLGFHDLRRSHASLLAHAGVSTAIAQKLMRHSDPKLTERVYTVVDVETLRREVGRMSFARAVSPRVSPERGQTARKALPSGSEELLAARDCKDLPASDPDRDRTCDLAFRKRSLYPTELRGRCAPLPGVHGGGKCVHPRPHRPDLLRPASVSKGASAASSVIPRARSRSTST